MEDCLMKRMLPVLLVGAALLGYVAGYASKPAPQPILTGHLDGLSMIPSVNAQENKKEVMPFGFNSPHDPPLAPDAPRSEEHTSELQSHSDLVCRLLLEKKK